MNKKKIIGLSVLALLLFLGYYPFRWRTLDRLFDKEFYVYGVGIRERIEVPERGIDMEPIRLSRFTPLLVLPVVREVPPMNFHDQFTDNPRLSEEMALKLEEILQGIRVRPRSLLTHSRVYPHIGNFLYREQVVLDIATVGTRWGWRALEFSNAATVRIFPSYNQRPGVFTVHSSDREAFYDVVSLLAQVDLD